MLNLQKIIEHWPAKLLALSAALLLFFFNRIDTMQQKTFLVPLRLVSDNSMLPAENFSHKIRITVRGSSEVITTLQDNELEAVADFSDIQNEGVFRAPIRVNFKGTVPDSESLEMTVDPVELNLRLEKKLVRTLPIQPNFSGQTGKNFELSAFHIIPSIITVEGPRSRLEKLSVMKTEPIDLRGKTENFAVKVRVAADSPLLAFPYGSTVDVLGNIKSSLGTLLIEKKEAQVTGLASSLVLKSPLPPVSVRIRGKDEVLKTVNGDQVKLILDLSGFSLPGEIPNVSFKVELPADVELVEISPPTATIFLEKSP